MKLAKESFLNVNTLTVYTMTSVERGPLSAPWFPGELPGGWTAGSSTTSLTAHVQYVQMRWKRKWKQPRLNRDQRMGLRIIFISVSPVLSYKSRYIVGFWLVEKAISTNQKPAIYNLYENTAPELCSVYHEVHLCMRDRSFTNQSKIKAFLLQTI